MLLPEDFKKTVLEIARKLSGHNYAIRGTASLVLQDINMNALDIDILTDKETALICNEIFKEYLKKKIVYSESPKFKSYFGSFELNNTLVEVMGEWEIKDAKGNWVKPKLIDKKEILIDGQKVWVTTIESELISFAAMGRWNAYWKIKKEALRLKS